MIRVMLSNQKFDSEIHQLYTRMWKKEKRGFCLLITLDGVREKELDKEAKKPRNKETDKMKVEEKTALSSVRKKKQGQRGSKEKKKRWKRKNCTLHKYL